jgi:hypothetical protein
MMKNSINLSFGAITGRHRILLGFICYLSPINSILVDCPPCGYDFCKDDPRYEKALSDKKVKLSAEGYPSYLTDLLNLDAPCIARVERSPDGFTIQRVFEKGNWETVSWSFEEEKKAKNDLKAGTLKSYNMFNVRNAFACCGDQNYNSRLDYNSNLNLNTNLAIVKK